MNPCPRPLDPIDAEAVAAGVEPVYASDAAEHARGCPVCGSAVARAATLLRCLEGLVEGLPGPDLVERVVRLRPFSRLERRSFALWRGPCLFVATLFFAGVLWLAWPGISVGEQVGVGMAALGPLVAFFRAVGRSLAEVVAGAPSALEALSEALRRESGIGFLALLLLVPVGFGFRRALARAARR